MSVQLSSGGPAANKSNSVFETASPIPSLGSFFRESNWLIKERTFRDHLFKNSAVAAKMPSCRRSVNRFDKNLFLRGLSIQWSTFYVNQIMTATSGIGL